MAAAFVYPNLDPVPFLKRTAGDRTCARSRARGRARPRRRARDDRTDRARTRRRDPARDARPRRYSRRRAARRHSWRFPPGKIAAKLANYAASVRSLHRRRRSDVSRCESGAFAVLANRRRPLRVGYGKLDGLPRRGGRCRQDLRDARSRAPAPGRRRRRRRRLRRNART